MPVPRPNAQAIPTQPQQPSTTSSGVTAAQVQRSAKGRSRAQRAALQEQPQVPAPPPTLEQSPPSAPNVRMQNGLLMIDAHNSTLSQVLRAVQQQTGASMEVPAGASNERVVAQIGPGQPRDVINTLLNGSKFDYVILGVLGNPGAVQKVILTPRQGGSTGSMNAQANTPPPPQPADDVQDESVPVADNGDADYQNQADQYQPPPGQPMPPGGFRRPMVNIQPQNQGGDNNGYSGPGGEAQGGKTPEELMQELQQMQQQQQNYQQQLNPANQNPQQ